jgi:GAF domain-containing protein
MTNGLDGARPGPQDDVDVDFADAARLELDDLLEQLIDRVRDVQRTQGRLRGLLRANLDVAQGVDLEHVLRQIVTAAKNLVGARYAALGVIQDGHLVRFLHEGMAPETVVAIGHLPAGKGLLGALVEHPHPVRLPEIADHPASVGFPDGHPPMHSFLGVPIRVRDQVFGNLYLSEKQGAAAFSRDDEEVAKALAGAAGVAIENATLFSETRRRRDWQEAMTAVTTALFEDAGAGGAMQALVDCAMRAGSSDGVAFVPAADEAIAEVGGGVAVGLLAFGEGRPVPGIGAFADCVLADGRPVMVADPAADPRTAAAVSDLPQLGSTVAAPIAGNRGAHGVLVVAYRRGGSSFGRADLEMITAFAGHAGLALDVAALRRENERIRVLEDRQRIAGDLQETLIRDLFGLGLSLQGVASRIASPQARAGLVDAVEELDRIIRGVRTAVFSMERRHRGQAPADTAL